MKKIYYILVLILLTNCSLNKVNKSHGNVNLNKKIEKLNINITNKNDVITILGPPSTKSEFEDNKWFFIERRMTNTSMLTLGREKLEANNVLILEFDNNGILASKKIYDKEKMQDLKFSENSVIVDYEKKNIFFNIMSSVRQKIQAPIKKSLKKKREN
tara:strand:- start:1797 stop:2270 length:474 start_codon:yes stop_codon:yes gene_type:complete